jgi:hypothetical protein
MEPHKFLRVLAGNQLRLVAVSKGQQLQRSSISDQNLDSAELEFRRFWMNLNKFDINWSKLYLPNPLNFTKSQKKIGRIFKPVRAGGDAAQRNFHAKRRRPAKDATNRRGRSSGKPKARWGPALTQAVRRLPRAAAVLAVENEVRAWVPRPLSLRAVHR